MKKNQCTNTYNSKRDNKTLYDGMKFIIGNKYCAGCPYVREGCQKCAVKDVYDYIKNKEQE